MPPPPLLLQPLLQLLLLVAVLVLLPPALAAVDFRTGHINPPPGVPDFNPVVWNGAWLLTLRGVPRSSTFYPRGPPGLEIGGSIPEACTPGDVSVPPAKGAPIGACTFSLSDDGSSYDLSIKLRGLALRNGNCLCYALEYFRGGYCLPGTSAGGAPRARYRNKMACSALNDAVVSDGAIRVSREKALNEQPSGGGHYIAMMARPDGSCVPGHCGNADFHVMRKDADGAWSWKLPGVPASNRDLAGGAIYDPEAAPLPGHYTVCGYFRVQPERMTIGASSEEAGPLDDMSVLAPFHDAGASITTSPLPYDPGTDAQIGEKNQQIFAEDLAWERKRGTAEYSAWNERQLAALEMRTGGGGGGGGSSSNSNNDGNGGNSDGGGGSSSRSSRRGSPSASGRRLAAAAVA